MYSFVVKRLFPDGNLSEDNPPEENSPEDNFSDDSSSQDDLFEDDDANTVENFHLPRSSSSTGTGTSNLGCVGVNEITPQLP